MKILNKIYTLKAWEAFEFLRIYGPEQPGALVQDNPWDKPIRMESGDTLSWDPEDDLCPRCEKIRLKPDEVYCEKCEDDMRSIKRKSF